MAHEITIDVTLRFDPLVSCVDVFWTKVKREMVYWPVIKAPFLKRRTRCAFDTLMGAADYGIRVASRFERMYFGGWL